MKATYVYRRYAKHARNVRSVAVLHVGMVRWKEIALRSSDDKQTIYANEVLSRERERGELLDIFSECSDILIQTLL